jgi:hypothetical protein
MAPRFILGFATLASLIPDIVGEPLENERWEGNGDSLQATSHGLLAYRKATNTPAFTNGDRTWVNGPFGLQERANEERFDWELGLPAVHDIAGALPVAPWNSHPTREASAITTVVVHWDGGPVTLPPAYDPVAYYKSEAFGHIAKNWAKPPEIARGYGLMYHEKISRDGHAWLTRPDTDVVWAASGANPFSYNICVDACEFSPPTVEQRSVLRMRLDALRVKHSLTRHRVFGHGELTSYGNATACPGPDLLELVRDYRSGG